MSLEKTQAPRGRPKKLDRQEVLKTALMLYWAKGPVSVSINELCDAAGVSKPGLYREFGNDDGLKLAVLNSYDDMILKPYREFLKDEQPLQQKLQALVEFIAQDRENLGAPNGCLHVSMRAHRNQLGESTLRRVDELQSLSLSSYEHLIRNAKKRGEMSKSLSTKSTAQFFDAQNSLAMRMQQEGASRQTIEYCLRLAFAVFT